jgi:TolB protein
MRPPVSLFRRHLIAAAGGMALLPAAQAELRVEISGVGATQYPIAVADFAGDAVGREIAEIIRADLSSTGLFRLIDASGANLSDSSLIGFAAWKTRGANALTVGGVQRLPDGRLDVRFRLLDTVQQVQLDGLAYTSAAAQLRRTAHQIADRIYEKLTGDKGVFATRIAYVLKQGPLFELQIADADGMNAQTALRSREPIISPAWSPDGGRLAYVSFELKKPVIYVHTLATGQRVPVANFKGNNSAPAWSPDGRQLAVVLSREGLSQLFIMNADGSGLRRLVRSSGIDTEPVFSRDGQTIYFTSDRGGNPQIYQVPVDGGDAQRVTFRGDYHVSPDLAPDGRSLVTVTRRGGRFQLALTDLASGNEILLTDGGRDESPSFAPNGKVILYATQERGRGVLAAVSTDARVRRILSAANSGDVREPVWGPFTA